jgi:transposase
MAGKRSPQSPSISQLTSPRNQIASRCRRLRHSGFQPHPGGHAAGALFGLTPKKYQSGEKDVTGGITLAGDEMVRTSLYEAANVLLSRITRFSKLKRWGMDVAKRRGSKRAKVALARKLAVILHRMWVDGTTYRWAEAEPIAA